MGGESAAYTPTDYILLSCGAPSSFPKPEDGRKWVTDEGSNFSTLNSNNTSFTSKASRHDQSVTQVPYMTARVFRDKFTYSFPVSAGLKFLRLYFYPVRYSGFDATVSFFSVIANDYKPVNYMSPFLPSPHSLAFVNGIEVVSMRNNMYENQKQNSVTFVNDATAMGIPDATTFETVCRLNVGGATMAYVGDSGMFRTWLHFCETQLQVTEEGQRVFEIFMDNKTAESGQSKQILWLSLHPAIDVGSKFVDAILNGLEIFRLNKSDGSLAVPNPEPGSSLAVPKPENMKKKEGQNNFASYQDHHWSCPGLHSNNITFPSTNDFDDAFVVGRGGYGNVYKGCIERIKCEVAIKRLASMSQQGAPEFWTEIQLLSQLRHRHLVSLIGYCDDNNEMILVYEYMTNGTLRDHLYNTEKAHLSRKKTLEILIGAAHGLDYLHSGAARRVIHRDVKSSKILLDEKYAAKVSNFGLSKMSPFSKTDVPLTTVVKGTLGYMDPEYYRRLQLTEKSDVYFFGVVLFEVLFGRAAVDSNFEYSQIRTGVSPAILLRNRAVGVRKAAIIRISSATICCWPTGIAGVSGHTSATLKDPTKMRIHQKHQLDVVSDYGGGAVGFY
ncbi:Detected protein of unknown function [Hibiscus syriacus]|uniref:Protein kinase domain-containing protein n=1 Tax=Hibiscus syriacus TaxID=106335 RepID=A0A6A3B8G8_HIBSY|nr:Detected protein of unknown function [Hibiscus syriacus]